MGVEWKKKTNDTKNTKQNAERRKTMRKYLEMKYEGYQ